MAPSAIAHYLLTAKIGEGGMGEVYRATDQKLGREVAVKIIPDQLARDADSIARLIREAQVLASLNHPNIAAIYGIEDRALVMELVEGPTLADLICKGPIPVDEALTIARQIANALEAAHDKGIVHRDLKPANVKVTPEGVVKVLDFGLARVTQAGSRVDDHEASPTQNLGETRPGTILGTVAYMAPEQARGGPVDKRADIWSFGVLLYELLTGKKPFGGESSSDILAAVLTRDPEWKGVPPAAERLLIHCLEKDPKRRLRDIGDAMYLLEGSTASPRATSSFRSKAARSIIGATLLLIFVFGIFLFWTRPQPMKQAVVRVGLDFGADTDSLNIGADAVLSADASRLVLISKDQDGIRRIYKRLVAESQPQQLDGTEGAYAPFFSPTGQWVGFFANGKLKKVKWDGGEPISLCDAPAGRGGSWADDDTIIAALDSQAGLSRVSSAGGEVSVLTEKQAGENSHRWPHILPGGKAVLFTSNTTYANFDDAQIALVDLTNGRRKVVLDHAGMFPHYVDSGHILYVSKGRLLAAAFDLARLAVHGTPTVVVDEVATNPVYGFAQMSVTPSGALLYRKGRTEGLRTIQWLTSKGEILPLVSQPALYQFPRFSPDGTRLAVVVTEGSTSTLWMYDWRRGSRTRLSSGVGVSTSPVWTPDGKYIVFQSPGGMFWTRVEGTGQPAVLSRSEVLQFPSSFSPDGRHLLFAEANPGPGANLRTLVVREDAGQLGTESPQLLVKLPSLNAFATFSPDGNWIAYASAESGIYEVYVRRFPDNGSKRQISTSGGTMPVWNPVSHELYYRTEDERIMVAAYSIKQDSFTAEKAREWSSRRLVNLGLNS